MVSKCGAKTRAGGKCKRKSMTNGRCYQHGGKSTGPPKGSKNALKTGEFESILVDQLEPEEQELYGKIKIEKRPLMEEELRIVTIRERRILGMIKGYREKLGVLLVVSEEKQSGVGPMGAVDITKEKKESVEASILRCEEAFTRIQAQKSRLIEQLHKMQLEDGGESPLDRLASSIAGMRKDHGG